MENQYWELPSWKKLKESLTNEQFQWLNTFQWEYYNLMMREFDEYKKSQSINFTSQEEEK